MPKIELGTVGAVLSPGDGNAFIDTAVELEELGYHTIWLTGGPLQSLSQIADVVRATKRARVASGIISVDRFGADEVSALYTGLQATHPGRFVVGLGGAHGPNPLQTLTSYLRPARGGALHGSSHGRPRTEDARPRPPPRRRRLSGPGDAGLHRKRPLPDRRGHPRWPLSSSSWSAPTPSGRGRSHAARSDSSAKSPPTRPASAGWGLPARRSASSAIALSTPSCPGAAPIPWPRPFPGSCEPEPTTLPFP